MYKITYISLLQLITLYQGRSNRAIRHNCLFRHTCLYKQPTSTK